MLEDDVVVEATGPLRYQRFAAAERKVFVKGTTSEHTVRRVERRAEQDEEQAEGEQA